MSEPLKTIAIADSTLDSVTQIQRVAQLWGYVCSGVANTGLETLALAQLYKPNILLLNFKMPGLSINDIIQQIMTLKTTAIILLASDTNYDACAQALDLGASAFLLPPYHAPQMHAVLQTVWHRFQKECLMHAEIAALKDGLETRKLIDRAKGILIAERGVTEPEAYRLLQKMSQDKRVSIKEVCRAIDQIRLVIGQKTKNKTTL